MSLHLAPRPIDRYLIGLFAGLSVFGLVILLSASGPISFQHYSDSLYFLRRQIILGLLPGLVAFFVLSRFRVQAIKPYALPFLVASLVLLALVFIPGLGHRVGGSTSWLDFRLFRIQPSEFVKVTFIIYAAAWLASRGQREGKTLQGAVPFLAAIAAIIVLLISQPDTGTTAVIMLTSFAMYFVAGAPLVWFAGIGVLIAFGLTILIKLTPYRSARFMTFLHPELDPQGVGYHINQAFLAIGSGGLFGLGYGQSRQKYLYLPEVQGDSIFAVMAEELGFVMVVFFIAAVAAIVWRCFVIARSANSDFEKYVCVGVGSWIALQTAVNIASMTGLMPMTGVTLPFVSYGNSATLSLSIGLGLVAAISRNASHDRARRV